MNLKHLTLVAAASLALSATALAGPDHGGQRDGLARTMHGDPPASVLMLHRMLRAIDQLELSEEQRSNIDSLAEDTRLDIHANMKASRKNLSALHEGIADGSLNEETLAELARQQGDLAAEQMMITGQVATEALAQLNDAQREELRAMAEAARERRGDRVSRRQSRKPKDS